MSAFYSALPFLKSPAIGRQGTKSAAACIYREVSWRSSPMVETVGKDWLEGRLAASLAEWGLPSSTISPRQRIRSLPNVENVEARCEMTISVDAVRPWRMFPRTTLSEDGSRPEVASSNIKIRGCCRSALAMASRWRWPPESWHAPGPIRWRKPSGNAATNCESPTLRMAP